jgi:hypothetical protein
MYAHGNRYRYRKTLLLRCCIHELNIDCIVHATAAINYSMVAPQPVPRSHEIAQSNTAARIINETHRSHTGSIHTEAPTNHSSQTIAEASKHGYMPYFKAYMPYCFRDPRDCVSGQKDICACRASECISGKLDLLAGFSRVPFGGSFFGACIRPSWNWNC